MINKNFYINISCAWGQPYGMMGGLSPSPSNSPPFGGNLAPKPLDIFSQSLCKFLCKKSLSRKKSFLYTVNVVGVAIAKKST